MYEFKYAKTNNSDVEKHKNHCKQNFEEERNKMQLHKENTQQSNLNNKYLNVTLVVYTCNIQICLLF